jgi:N-methylhydantoinase A
VKYNYMATAPLRLDNDAAYARIDTLFAQIEAQGTGHLKGDGFGGRDIVTKRSLDLRYVGQVHECTVEIGRFRVDAKSVGKIRDAFHRRHKELYTYAEPASTVEVVNIESTLYGIVDKPARMSIGKGVSPDKALKGHRDAVFGADGRRTRTPIYDGTPLGAGAVIKGPAVVEEVTTTLVIEPGWTARLDASGSYLITRGRKGAR